MRTKRTDCFVFLAAVVALLNGCSSGPNWTHQRFAFSLPAEAPSSDSPTNYVALGRVNVSPLFQSRSFTYRTAENTYDQDPYADFMVAPGSALAEPMRAWLRAGGAFGRVVEPGSQLTPSIVVEASVNELCGDFRKPAEPVAAMEIHFLVYEITSDVPGRILLDRTCSRRTPLSKHTAAALIAAWDADLRGIMEEINSAYAKARSGGH